MQITIISSTTGVTPDLPTYYHFEIHSYIYIYIVGSSKDKYHPVFMVDINTKTYIDLIHSKVDISANIIFHKLD